MKTPAAVSAAGESHKIRSDFLRFFGELFLFSQTDAVLVGDTDTHVGQDDVHHRHQPVEDRPGAVAAGAPDRGLQRGLHVGAAGVPGNQRGGDGGGALQRVGQRRGIDVHLVEVLGVHTAADDDGNVLVGHGHVGEDAGALGNGNQTGGGLDDLLDLLDELAEHAGALHDAAVHHGDHDQGDGVAHVADTAAAEKLGDCIVDRGKDVLAVEAGGEGEALFQRKAVIAGVDQGAEGGAVRKDDSQHRTGEQAHGQAGDRGDLQCNGNDDHQGRQHQQGVDVGEGLLDGVAKGVGNGHIARADRAGVEGAVEAEQIRVGCQRHQREDRQGDDIGNARGDQHELDVGHDVRAGHSRGQVRGIGQGGHLVAEVGAGNDRAGRDGGVDAQAVGDAQEGNAHGGRRAPGGAGRDGGDGADDHDSRQEEARAHDLQTVVNHRGNDACTHPDADHHADDQKDHDGLQRSADAVDHHLLKRGPLEADHQGRQDRHDCRQEERCMDVVDLFDQQGNRNQRHGDEQNEHGLPELWLRLAFSLLFSLFHFLFLSHELKYQPFHSLFICWAPISTARQHT